jgi:hypothetical protein
MNIGVEWVGGRWDQMLAAEALVMTKGTCFTGSTLRAVTCFGVNAPAPFPSSSTFVHDNINFSSIDTTRQ